MVFFSYLITANIFQQTKSLESTVLSNNRENSCIILDGKLNGNNCELTHNDGTILKGVFKGGALTGDGAAYFSNGVILEGLFEKNDFVKGIKTYPTGGQDIGSFTNGQLKGENCTRIYPNKKKILEGTFKDNELFYGNITYFNGDVERGFFDKGRLEEGIRVTTHYAEEGVFESGIFQYGKLNFTKLGLVEYGARNNGNLHGENCTRIRSINNITEIGTFRNNDFISGTVIVSRNQLEVGNRNKQGQITGGCKINYFSGASAGVELNGTCHQGALVEGTIFHKLSETLLTVSASNTFSLMGQYTNLNLDSGCEDTFRKADTPFVYNSDFASSHNVFMQRFGFHANTFFDLFLKDIDREFSLGETVLKTHFDLNFSDLKHDDFFLILDKIHSFDENSQHFLLASIAKTLILIDQKKDIRNRLNKLFKTILTQDITVFNGLRTFSRVSLTPNLFNIIFISYLKHVNTYIKPHIPSINFSFKFDSQLSFVYLTNVDQYTFALKDYFNISNRLSEQVILPLNLHSFEGRGFRIPHQLIEEFKSKNPSENFSTHYVDFIKNIFFQVSSRNEKMLKGTATNAQQSFEILDIVKWNKCAQKAIYLADNNYHQLGQLGCKETVLYGTAFVGLLCSFIFLNKNLFFYNRLFR